MVMGTDTALTGWVNGGYIGKCPHFGKMYTGVSGSNEAPCLKKIYMFRERKGEGQHMW